MAQQSQNWHYPNNSANHYQNNQPSKEAVQNQFQHMLSRLQSPLDHSAANEISWFTQQYHGLAAYEITNVITDFITSKQERQFVYLYVMDNILKYVQGDYIRYFEQKLKFVIGIVLQKCLNNQEDQKRLFKLFKTWEVLGLFNQQNLDAIAAQHNLRSLESQLTNEEREKILRLKDGHEPTHLPQELFQSDRYIIGDSVNRDEFRQRQLARQYGGTNQQQAAYWQQQQQQQQQNGNPAINQQAYNQQQHYGYGGYQQQQQQQQQSQQPTGQDQQSIQQLLATLGSIHQQTASTTQNTSAADQSRVQQPVQQPTQSAAETAQQDERESSTTNGRRAAAAQVIASAAQQAQDNAPTATPQTTTAAMGPQQQQPHHQPPQQQQQQHHYNAGPDHQQHPQQQTASQSQQQQQPPQQQHQIHHQQHQQQQQYRQHQSGTSGYGGRANNIVSTSSPGVLARNSNVQSNQKSVGFRQFGFLPSLLKSFSSFNKTQQLSLGNFIFHQASSTAPESLHNAAGSVPQHLQCPTFQNKESLLKPSEAAQCEIFTGIKFYCALCGMRFVRNVALKEHLNAHFEANLALKRRGDRTMARDQFQGFSEFVAPRKHVIKQDGEAAGGTNNLKKDLVLYDGTKSHITQYNFCYLCKERLDTYHDDVDENWYFLDTKQVRFKSKSGADNTAPSSGSGAANAPTSVFNVHTNCLKEIEELNFQNPASNKPAEAAAATAKSASEKMEVPVSIVGQKRTYVDAQKSGGPSTMDAQLRGLQDIIRGLESQKRRRGAE